MNKKTIIIAAVVVVLAGAGVAGWMTMNRQDEPANNSTNQTDQPKQVESEQSPKTINGFLAAGKNQKCTFSSSSGNSKTMERCILPKTECVESTPKLRTVRQQTVR
jgi:flagellar basal body-associated protein FliL